jgi:hypothetical protein
MRKTNNMKKTIPTMAIVASLAFASANSFAQKPAPLPAIPKTPIATVAVAPPAQDEVEAVAATEAAFAGQEAALEAQNDALAKVEQNLQTISTHAGHARSSSRSLVIPKDAGDAKSLTDTEEDMSVMARILEKAANGKKSGSERTGNYTVWTVGTPIGISRNLYLDGYGAIFFLNVNYPLLPPAAKEQPAESKSETDTEWEKTKNEIYRPQTSSSDLSFNFTPFESGYSYSTGGPAEEYDEDKVSDLKENLVAALKNAGHIRRLKGDDTVTLVVTGRGAGPALKTAMRRSQNGSSSSTSSSSSFSTLRSGSQAPAARLILRAKRSDIESFQKDKLNADDFRKKLTIFTY